MWILIFLAYVEMKLIECCYCFRRFANVASENQKVSWTTLCPYLFFFLIVLKALLCCLLIFLLFSDTKFADWIFGWLPCWAKLAGLWLFKILAFYHGCISYISCQVYYLAWSASLGKYIIFLIMIYFSSF